MNHENIVYCDSEQDRERKKAADQERFEWKAKRSRRAAQSTPVRRFVMQRADSSCEICRFNFESILHIHHIMPVQFGGSAKVQNLITLCPNCHGMVHHYKKARNEEQRAAWMRGVQSAGYTKDQARRILLIASQEAVINHDGSIESQTPPPPTCYLLISEMKRVGEQNDDSLTAPP